MTSVPLRRRCGLLLTARLLLGEKKIHLLHGFFNRKLGVTSSSQNFLKKFLSNV